jgi:transcriptional regulator with XRE-family HTH domain
MTPTLGDQVRDARVEAGISLRELARQLERAPSYLNDIEHGRRVPSEEVLKSLAEALHLDAGRLMTSAGRVGSDTTAYMQSVPEAGVLFRKVSGANLSPGDLQQLIKQADRIITKREKDQQD